jgi:uncharacterized protein
MLYRPRLRKRVFYAIAGSLVLALLIAATWLAYLVHPRLVAVPLVVACLCLAWAVLLERHWVEFTHHEVVLEGLPERLDGYRIVHLSDLHWDAYTHPRRVHALLERVNGLGADLIVITGDMITHYREFIEPCSQALRTLQARCGVYAVLGNHDHWASGRLMTAALESQGLQVLTNTHRFMDGFWLVGVDDPHLQRADLPRALDGVADDGLPRILLAHSPDVMKDAPSLVDLVLCGHTHAGQVRLPLVGAVMHATRRPQGRRFVRGWGREGSTQVFTSRGIGSVLLPMRFLCRPEVAVHHLRARTRP